LKEPLFNSTDCQIMMSSKVRIYRPIDLIFLLIPYMVLCMSTNEKRIVITGIGAVTPIGQNIPDYWKALEAGANGVQKVYRMVLADFHVQIAAEIELSEASKQYIKARKMVRRLDDHILFATIAGAQAVIDAGLENHDEPERIGAIIGSGEGGLKTHYDQITRINARGLSTISPYYVTNVIPNSGGAFLAQERNFQGPSFTTTSACASSNHALGIACMLIKSGMADVMFAGGSEAVATPPSMAAFGNIGALSSRNDDPEHASRPFDRDRDGFVMGEGSGVLCLEELEHAKKRGAKIYAELTGFGFSSDAYDLVAPHPEGKGAGRAIKLCLEMARLNPEQIGLINCHGTSTPTGDYAESLAINHAFGPELAAKIPVHSTKSMIGHLIGAASAVEAIAGIMVFEKGIIHKTRNLENKDPNINLNVLTENTDGRKVDHILSNAFGFGGHNACVVLSRFKG